MSGSNEIGEGEHKLFSYIRLHPEKHASETTVIYGLDADLIMLSINHLPVSPKIYLFRETPHFIKSIDSSLEPNSNYLLDIPKFVNALTNFITNGIYNDETKKKNIIYDYIFICFFLGNDFLPHFPALNIRTGGVDKMIMAYKNTINNENLNLTDGKTIFWKNVKKLIEYLATKEEEFIVKEYYLRNKIEKRNFLNDNTPEDKFKKIEMIPQYEREIEHFINPTKLLWQNRYYHALFRKSELNVKNIVYNYLEGLEWTMTYYTTGCKDWRWNYKYDYPPLLQDLLKFMPSFDKEFISEKTLNPVSEIVQLCYVLPRNSLNLLPNDLCFSLIKKYDNLYNCDCNFVWAYCKYFWEAHVDMSEITIEELETFVGAYARPPIHTIRY